MSPELIITILSSSALAALLTAIFSKLNNDKNILIENVVKERKAWRDKIRELVLKTEDGFQRKDEGCINCVSAQLTVLLNPKDDNDKDILQSIIYIKKSWDRPKVEEFYSRVSLLLKHDWERVKKETKINVSPQTLLMASIYTAIYFSIINSYLFNEINNIKIIIFILGLLLLPIINNVMFFGMSKIMSHFGLEKVSSILYFMRNKAFRYKYK